MKKLAIASVLLLGLTAPAFAASSMSQQDSKDTNPNFSYQAKSHWAVIDTVGNCAVIDAQPGSYDTSGLKILGNKNGYPSFSEAKNELNSNKGVCKGMVGSV